MRVSRTTMRRLLELHALTGNVLRLADGRTQAELDGEAALQSAIRQQARLALDEAHQIREHEAALLAAHVGDIARLGNTAMAVSDLLAPVRNVHGGVTRALETVELPRWTSLGLRHRRRRQLGRGDW